jgi:hypothetical protein
MSPFAESIKRLYDSGKIAHSVVQTLFAGGKLNKAELDSILGLSEESSRKHSMPDGVAL